MGVSAAAIELRDVFCVHRTNEGDAAALQGLSLRLRHGERLCVLGPSGAGKTTLLRVIAGLQAPSAGSVMVFGRDAGRLGARERARLRHQFVGFLDQHAESTLPPELRIADAVAMPLALRGVRRAQRRSRTAALLRTAGLGDRADAFASELSGGERQRVALCAAVAHRPPLLLADEPTAELDEPSARDIAGLIDELAEAEGTTVIVVSHDPAMADNAERAVRIRDGRIVEERLHGGRTLVVGPGGWIRVPSPLLEETGIGATARAEVLGDGVLLTPAGAERRAPPDLAAPRTAATSATRRACAAAVAVELRSVSRSRGRGARRRAVIEQLSVSFAPGCLTAVTGRSGSGKTTLLELVAALRTPDAGDLLLDDASLAGLDDERLAEVRRRRIGYLPQEPSPVGFLSAAENVSLALRIRGRSADRASRAADDILARVGLADRAQQRVWRLSAGEAQRVALARAMASAEGLLVVDEPTSRLDQASAAAVARLLAETATGDGQTIICATHDLELIRHADHVLELGATAPRRTAVAR
ncbi:MAG TPA: ATP-binding cassette domain-containing protein [Solirubrobacteraceae bacterium]